MPLPKEALGRVTDEEGKVTTHVDLLLHGESGAGKTFRAATAPGPIYVLSTDPTGHKSVPFKADGKVVRRVQDVREVITGFKEGGHGYSSLLFDGLSFMYDLFLMEVGQDFYETKGAKDPHMLPQGAYGKIMGMYRDMLRAVVNLTQVENEADRVHVIFTTLSERLKEDDEAPFKIRPLFGSAKMNEKFAAIPSIIGYIRQSEKTTEKGQPDETRVMLFTNYKGIMARDRLGIFPGIMTEAPNLSEYLK